MTTLFLDGKQAIFKEGQTLKLVREDTYFTKSGTYTYDIVLPVCPENIAIFGALSRKDISKGVEMKYKALLVVNNRDILNGTATVTNISEEEIRLYRILDVTLKRSFWERLFNLGTLHLCTADKSSPEIDVLHIKNPREVRTLLSDRVEEERASRYVGIREYMDEDETNEDVHG